MLALFCLQVLDDLSCCDDRPLVVQFCANTVEKFVKAAVVVQSFCDAVDLNLGCPQHIARRGSCVHKLLWVLISWWFQFCS